ncbi:MAG: riboflavin synthase [Proteobacteria bacterium]|nr:riboflavin synthase [Pseudomonadota bacterium]
MFTGIIQKTGTVRSLSQDGNGSVALEMTNPFSQDSDPVILGESIANNGVCLTVAAFSTDSLRFDLAPETLRVTALSRLKPGSRVNLERALRLGDRLSGHWVQGHVDGTAAVTRIEPIEQGCYSVGVELPDPSFLKYCVLKGSLTLDGISLTIHEIRDQSLQFQIIPHTWRETALSDLCRGDLVNFEVDILAKYIERQRS